MHGHDEADKDHPEDALAVSGSHVGASGKPPLEEVEDAALPKTSPTARGPRSLKSTVKMRQHLQKALQIGSAAGTSNHLAAIGSSLAEDADDAAKMVKPPQVSPTDKSLTAAMRSSMNRGQERQARQRNRGALMRAQTKDYDDEFMKDGMIEGKAAAKSPRKATISESVEVTQGAEQEEEDAEEHSETGTAASSTSPIVTPKGSKRRSAHASAGSPLAGSSPTEGTVDETPNLPVMPAMLRPGNSSRRRSTEVEADTLSPSPAARRRSTEAQADNLRPAVSARRRSAETETDMLQPSASFRRRSAEADTDAALGISGLPQLSKTSRRRSTEAETDSPLGSPGMMRRRPSMAVAAPFARQCSPDSNPEELQGLAVGPQGFLASQGQGARTPGTGTGSLPASPMPMQAAKVASSSSPPSAESPQFGIGRTEGRRPSVMANMMQGIRRGSTVRQFDQDQLMKSLGAKRRKSKKVRKAARLSAQFTSDPGRQPDPEALLEEDEEHADSAHSNSDHSPDEDKLDEEQEDGTLSTLPEVSQADAGTSSSLPEVAGTAPSLASLIYTEPTEALAAPKEGQEDKDEGLQLSHGSDKPESMWQEEQQVGVKEAPMQIVVTDNEPIFSDNSDSGFGEDSEDFSRRASKQSDQQRSDMDYTMGRSASSRSLGAESSKSLGGDSAQIFVMKEGNMSRSASSRSLGAESEKSTATNATNASKKDGGSPKNSKRKSSGKRITPRASERKSTSRDMNARQSVKDSKEAPETQSKWSKLRKVFVGKKVVELPEATSRRDSDCEVDSDGEKEPESPGEGSSQYLLRRIGVSVDDREEYLKPLSLDDADAKSADAKSEKSEPQRPKSALKKTSKSDPSDPSSRDEAKSRSSMARLKGAVTKINIVRKLSNFSASIQQNRARKTQDTKPRKQLRMLALNAPGTKIVRRRSDDTKALTPRRISGGGRDDARRLSSGAAPSRMKQLQEKDRSWVDMPYCGSRDDTATENKDGSDSRFRDFLRQRQLLSAAKASFKKLQAMGGTDNPLLKIKAAAEAVTEGVRKIQMQRHVVNSFWTTLAERQMRLKIATMLQDVLLRKDENGNEPPCGQAEVSYMSQCLSKCESELLTMKAGEKGAHLMLKTLQAQVGQFHQKLHRQKEAAAEMYNTEMQLRRMAEVMEENPGELWRKVWNANAFVNRVRMSTMDLKDVLFEFGTPKVTMSTLMAGGLRMADVSEDQKTPKTPKKNGFDSNDTEEPASPTGRRNRSCTIMPEDEDAEDADAMLKMLPEMTVNSLLEELKQTAGDVRAHVKCAKELSKLGVSYTDVPRLVESLCAQAWRHCVDKAIQKLTAGNDRDATSLRTVLTEIEERLQSEFPGSRPQLMKFSGRRTSTNLLATLREQEALAEEDDDDDLDAAIVNPETGRTRRGSICPMKTLAVGERISTPGPSKKNHTRERICTPGPSKMANMDDDNASFYSSSSEGEADDKQAPQELAQPSETSGDTGTSSIQIALPAGGEDQPIIRRRHSAPGYLRSQTDPVESPSMGALRRQSMLGIPRSWKKPQKAKDMHKAMQAKAEDILAMGEDRLGVGVLPMSRRPSHTSELPETPRNMKHRASFSSFGAASLPLSDDLRALWQKMQSSSSLQLSPMSRRGSIDTSRRPSMGMGSSVGSMGMSMSRRGSIEMSRRGSIDSRRSSLSGRRVSVGGLEDSMFNTMSPAIGEQKRPSILNALQAHAKKLKDSLLKSKGSKADGQKEEQADAGTLSDEENQQKEDISGNSAEARPWVNRSDYAEQVDSPASPRQFSRSKTLGAPPSKTQNQDSSKEADELRPFGLPAPSSVRRSSLCATQTMPFLSSRPGSRNQQVSRPTSRTQLHTRPVSRTQPFARPASSMLGPPRGKCLVEISTRLRGEWGHVKAQRQLAAGRTVAAWLGQMPKPQLLPEVESPRASPRNGRDCSGPSLRRPLFLVADSFITPAKSRFQAAQCSRPVSSETSTGFGLSNEFNFSASLAESDSSEAFKRALWSPSSAGSAASPSSRPATSGTCGISRCKNEGEGAGNSVLLFLPVLSGPSRQLSTPNSGRGSATPLASPRGSVVG